MGRLSSLDFDANFGYEESASGILVPIRLVHDGQSVELSARLDTGAADCLFDRFYAEILGLPEAGVERRYRTVTGSFQAFGHEVTIETLGLRWSALVFFHAMGNPAHSFVGRRGWLDRVRLGIVHHERRLLLGNT
jgi:predicted aspartyl protease